jgi:uncharacterized repeat protein (TIGR03803 family)
MRTRSLAIPAATLILVAAGSGALFARTHGAGLTGLVEFSRANGAAPFAGLIATGAGTLVGATTAGGGTSRECPNLGCGVIFELLPKGSGYTEREIYRFQGADDGSAPSSSLVQSPSGVLYGTSFGGANHRGVVFALAPDGSHYDFSIVYSFTCCTDASFPGAPLIADASGALYGTTSGGGTAEEGAVFKLTPTPSGFTESVLYSFQGGSDGANPYASLLLDGSGALWGTTFRDGAHDEDSGTVFRLTPTPSGYEETVVYRFPGGKASGAAPCAGLIEDANGVLYGTTEIAGRYGYGTVYTLTPSGSTYVEKTIHDFRGRSDGAYSCSNLIFGANGTLYGTTLNGGTNNLGTVFELTPKGSTFTERVVHSFQGPPGDGSEPFAGVISDGVGNLYGTTVEGGAHNRGTAFKLNL